MTNKLRHSSTPTPISLLYRLLLITLSFVFVFPSSTSTALAVSKEKEAPRGESKWTKLDATRIHYVNYGKGDEALVLIHGWTQNVDGWRDQIADFANRGRVIAIDLPGHGKSDKPRFTNASVPKDQPSPPFVYSMELFARAVEAVMRDAGIKRAVLIGHSMGTPIARQFYRKYPEKTLGIVIVDGALRPFFPKAMMDGLITGLRGPNHRQTIEQMFGMMMGGISEEGKARITSSTLNTPQHVFVSAMEGMADSSIWGEDKINVPVLAIMARSPMFPPDVESGYRLLAPSIEFQMWDGVGHFIMMEKPKEFNAAVLKWLDRNNLVKK
jgi:pimeloyl-ACP methyl ester carboxylesterase